LPPLRERREDIPLLVDHFIRKLNKEMGREVKCVTEDTIRRLIEYPWPGNVRELENQIKRAMVISRENILSEYLFDMDWTKAAAFEESAGKQLKQTTKEYFEELLMTADPPQSIFDKVVGSVEKSLIFEALGRTGGNQVQAAKLLGIHRSTLRKKRKDYKI
jgi:DNA-binding NtrC family response regulator